MKRTDSKELNVDISDRIAKLSDEKRALLNARLKEIGLIQEGKIGKREGVGESASLSFAQERLWFLSQLQSESTFYNEAGAIELVGKLDIPILTQSLQEIVRRHEILRTTFSTDDEGYVRQFIAPELKVVIRYEELQMLPSHQQIDETKRFMLDEVKRPFDLNVGPLIRFILIQFAAEKYILLTSLHHIIADEWSIRILLHELGAIYSALRAGESLSFAELPIQYADYACWQREWLKGSTFNKQIAYWTEQLRGSPALLELPIDFSRPSVLQHVGARHHFTIPQETAISLIQLGKNHGATLFMTLAATFAIFLNRYTNQDDICIGYPIANRARAGLQELIGFFANTLVLRTDLSGNPTFLEILLRVRKVCLEAQAHQDCPFEKLVEVLAPVRNINHNPLFQVMFVFQNTTAEKRLELSDIKLTELEVETESAKFDLTLGIREENGMLRGWFEYDTGLFHKNTIARWVAHYQQLLKRITLVVDRPLSNISILPDEERDQLLLRWNNTKTEYPRGKCIHHLFEDQVKQDPDAIALVFEGEQLTYGELNRKSNRLAHYLRAQGVGPEKLVGICVERSLEMIVGILGILKAGGAYLPIDPDYPKERIVFMLADADPAVILIHEATRGVVPDEANVFDLNIEGNGTEKFSEGNPVYWIQVQNLAYVIYTSGSTGKPKGSSLAHQGVVNRLIWMQQQYPINEEDSVLQKTPFSFDVSVWEFFWPLMVGARLVVLSPGAHKDSHRITELIKQERISTLHFVPSMLSVFLETADVSLCQSLKQVFCSGEALSVNLQKQFFAKISARLHNLYGPTEASVEVTYWTCMRDSADAAVPIGRPIANARIYLLDGYLNPVPLGVAGELYIGGIGLARGYLNQSELTADRFIPDPFERTGGRLYRTGDLARYRVDGNIEYIGRTDHQVKIRGFRIELGEIEAILLRHSQIREAVVVARAESTSGNQRLVAYVVGKEIEPSIEDLRTYLKEYLPDYMVPAAFVWLDCLPLNTNGKIDRKALPQPDVDTQFADRYVAPRTHTEEAIALIWAEVLGLERVGIHDNFFELGGHSLLVTQVILRIHTKLHIKIPLRSVFEAGTIADLAETVEAIQWAEENDISEMMRKDLGYEDIVI